MSAWMTFVARMTDRLSHEQREDLLRLIVTGGHPHDEAFDDPGRWPLLGFGMVMGALRRDFRFPIEVAIARAQAMPARERAVLVALVLASRAEPGDRAGDPATIAAWLLARHPDLLLAEAEGGSE